MIYKHKTFVAITLTISVLLSACGVKAPEPIEWEGPSTSPNMDSVDLSNPLIEQVKEQDTYPNSSSLLSPHLFEIRLVSFCDGDPNHECVGDSQNGWRGLYQDYSLIMIVFFVFGKQLTVETVNGEYFLSCGGYGGSRKQVTEDFVLNLKGKIKRFKDAQKEYEYASQDASSAVGWAIAAGVITCGGAIVFTGLTAGWGSPSLLPACGWAGAIGVGAGGLAAWGSSNTQTSRAEQELRAAEKELNEIKKLCPY